MYYIVTGTFFGNTAWQRSLRWTTRKTRPLRRRGPGGAQGAGKSKRGGPHVKVRGHQRDAQERHVAAGGQDLVKPHGHVVGGAAGHRARHPHRVRVVYQGRVGGVLHLGSDAKSGRAGARGGPAASDLPRKQHGQPCAAPRRDAQPGLHVHVRSHCSKKIGGRGSGGVNFRGSDSGAAH